MFTSHSYSITTKNDQRLYFLQLFHAYGKHLYCLQLLYAPNIYTSYICFMPTANIFTSTAALYGKYLHFLQLFYVYGKHLYFLQLLCAANIFTSYSWSITIMNGKRLYLLQLLYTCDKHIYFLQLVYTYGKHLYTYSCSVTMMNGKHLYFLQLVCCDEERQTSLLPTAGLLRLQSGGREALAASNLEGWQLPTGSCHDKPGPWKRRLGWSDGTCFMDGSFPDSFLH